MTPRDDELSTLALFGLMLGVILLPVAVMQMIVEWPRWLFMFLTVAVAYVGAHLLMRP